MQLDKLQSQSLDSRDDAVQRGAVGHPTHQQGLGRCPTRLKRIECCQQPRSQPAGDPKREFSAHVVLPSGGSNPGGWGPPVVMVGALG